MSQCHNIRIELLQNLKNNMFKNKLSTRITPGNIQFEEFQRCHQVDRVDDYIKNFVNVKSKIMQSIVAFTEEVFVAGFVCGLKDEIKNG
jgi:hypothetical protein